MILLLQAVTRLVTLLLLLALAVAGLALAVFSVPAAESGLGELADLVGLDLARDEVGTFLGTLESTAGFEEAIACFAAALAGAALVAGALLRRPDRTVGVSSSESGEGRLAVRPRALAQMAAARASRVRETESLRVAVRGTRGTGGTIRVRARMRGSGDTARIAERITGELRPLTEPLGLRPQVSARPATGAFDHDPSHAPRTREAGGADAADDRGAGAEADSGPRAGG